MTVDRPLAAGLGVLFFGAADFGFFALAGAAIDAELRLDGAYPWLFSASAFAFASVLMPSGVAVLRYGHAWVLRIGVAGVIAGLAVCSLADDTVTLLTGRALEGAGAGAMAPAAWGAIACSTARGERALATSGAAVSLGFAAGVLWGGPAAALIGWRPAVAGLALPLLPCLAVPLARRIDAGARVTVAVLGFSAGLVALSVGLALLAAEPGAGAATVAGGGMLWLASARAGRTEGWLPCDRQRWVACGLASAVTASGVGATILLGLALTETAHASPEEAAMMLAAFGVSAPVAAHVTASVAQRAGGIACAALGLALQALGLLALVLGTIRPATAVVGMGIAGFGHVVANGGVAEAVLAGGTRPAGAALAASQYLGSGAGALLVLEAAGDPLTASGAGQGLAVAALLGLAGAATAGGWLVVQPRAASQRRRDRA